jgi:hypothetical protein
MFSSATLAKLVWPSRKTIDSLADRRWEPLLNGPSGASTDSSTHVDGVWTLWNSWLAAVSEGVKKMQSATQQFELGWNRAHAVSYGALMA